MPKINVKNEDLATCKVWSVIGILNGKNVCPAEIHRQIVEVYGKGAMNEGEKCEEMCWLIREGRANVHDKEQSGCPSLVTYDFKQQLNAEIWENR